uniref:acidic leucine-rich nuclear phosphoprotein 32 family member B-like n=1 Tax=Myxine glutinosa TaxID=7769 RepID=UPI00358E852A
MPTMDMKKRLNLELRGRSPEQIKELVLDDCCAPGGEIDGLSDDFKALTSLQLSGAGLTSLANLPRLPALRRLELCNNNISGGLDVLVERTAALVNLSLFDNNIRDLNSLEPLKKLPQLRCLDLINCEVTSTPGYRSSIFDQLPQLLYLDGFDRENEDAPESEGDDLSDVDATGDHCKKKKAKGMPRSDDDDDDDDDDEVEDDDDDDEDDENEVGLEYLNRDNLQEDEENDGIMKRRKKMMRMKKRRRKMMLREGKKKRRLTAVREARSENVKMKMRMRGRAINNVWLLSSCPTSGFCVSTVM